MLSNFIGFTEYDLTTRQKVRDIRPQGVSAVQSARRLPNGNTLLAAEGISVWIQGGVVRRVLIPGAAPDIAELLRLVLHWLALRDERE